MSRGSDPARICVFHGVDGAHGIAVQNFYSILAALNSLFQILTYYQGVRVNAFDCFLVLYLAKQLKQSSKRILVRKKPLTGNKSTNVKAETSPFNVVPFFP